ncbi:helicase-related protein [Microbacterium gorillae]|uniref:helicase-related protein n=1 Tax=Microbacterium gorillae TaxID=1231063 RepID=UPI003D96043C
MAHSSHITSQLAAVKLAHTLMLGGSVTADQQSTLRQFAGWGALARAFAKEPKGQWLEAADLLDEVVPADALLRAGEQLDTSFFTPTHITDAVFDLLRSTGFTSGRVLEPGCGSGAFMSAAPADLDIDWTGVEVDPTSARIASILHPSAEIIVGKLENTVLRDEHYDAAVGNVPFSSVRVRDSEGRSGALHNYFIERAVAAVRPGGYIILVTSRHTIDSQHGILESIRDMQGAAFIGAVRLPSGAFAESGTDAVTDIVVIRRNDPTCTRTAYAGPADFEQVDLGWDSYGYRPRRETRDLRVVIAEPDVPGQEISEPAIVSRYWELNPAHVAGVMRSTTFTRSPLVVRSEDPAGDVARSIGALIELMPPMAERTDIADLSDVVLVDAEGRKEGSIHALDGQLFRVERGVLVSLRANKELTALVELRDLAVELLDAESNPHTPDEEIAPLRDSARAAYTAYVSRFGNLNRGTLVEGRTDEETGLPALSWRRPPMGGFRRDPDAPLVMALEVFDQDTGEAGPAPILLHRVNRAPKPIERVDEPAEALAVSMGTTGRVDLSVITRLLGLASDGEARAALGDLVFHDGERLVPAAQFLSGNIRRKIAEAEQRGDDRAAAALRSVTPADLGPLEIRMGLGSPIVKPADVEAFLQQEMGVRWASVHRAAEVGVWEVGDAQSDPAAQLKYGTADAAPWYLVECALNSRMPEITDREWNSDRQAWVQIRNPQKCAAANEKLELIRDRFSTWVWEDEERATRICREYNDKLNSHVPRVYTGAGFTFPGIGVDFTLWPHQRAAVERIVSTPRTMIAHPVGAGKTKSMIAAARTLRQFGLANKPLIVVPNHLLDQIAREAQQTFPTGRFLVASKEDLARDARRLFAARCATGDWDAVIMTHSAFTSIPVHPDSETGWLNDETFDLRCALQTTEGGRKEKGPKAISRAIRALEARIWKLRDNALTDRDAIFFEQLGVDYIMVDEAHLFRRLATNSTSRDNGFGSGASKRATDLLVKIETLAARRPAGAPIVSLFTGTPWSNTLSESWVWQRYLQPDALHELDLIAFDAWVSAFVRYETNIEVAPDGSGFRLQRRPVGMINAPEFKMLFAQVADILDPKKLGLDRPEHTVETVVVDPTPGQRSFVHDLANRADAIRNKTAQRRSNVTGGQTDDSMLLVCTDGRKVALDPQLVNVSERSSKVQKLAELVGAAYRENEGLLFGSHPTRGAFQLVFLDLGTPKPSDSSTYGRLRRAIVDQGVPAAQVRFVHDAKTDKARAALFASCRDGEVSVLIASTSKAGMGTNVQTRLTHVWHADAPWLPSDVIQRDGRAIRPGNMSGHVRITRLVTEGTFDAYTWQALERKSRSFDALYATGATAREIEDISAASISYGEVKALASGNPLLLEQATVRAEVKKLQLMRSVHLQSIRKAEQSAKRLDERADWLRRAAKRAKGALRVISEAATDDERTHLERAVEGWITAQLNGGGYGLAYTATQRASWRGIALRPKHESRRLVHVDIDVDYNTIESIQVPPKLIRRGWRPVADLIAATTDRVLDALPERVTEWTEAAEDCATQADEARFAAATSYFPDEAKLQDALSRLAHVEAKIAEDANEHAVVLA